MLGKEATDSLGTLLLGTGVVSPEQLNEAKKTAKNLNVTVARAILMLKMASEPSLHLVQEADALIQDGTISTDLAIRALRLARQQNMLLQDAISVLGNVHKKTTRLPAITT